MRIILLIIFAFIFHFQSFAVEDSSELPVVTKVERVPQHDKVSDQVSSELWITISGKWCIQPQANDAYQIQIERSGARIERNIFVSVVRKANVVDGACANPGSYSFTLQSKDIASNESFVLKNPTVQWGLW